MGVSAQQNRINVAIAAWEWPSYFDPEERLKGIRLIWQNIAVPRLKPRHATRRLGLYMICTLSKHRS